MRLLDCENYKITIAVNGYFQDYYEHDEKYFVIARKDSYFLCRQQESLLVVYKKYKPDLTLGMIQAIIALHNEFELRQNREARWETVQN